MNKKNMLIIIVIFILFFICCFPTYVGMKNLGYPKYQLPELWNSLDSFMLKNKFLRPFAKCIDHKIPEWTMPIAVIVNGINMFFGFKEYKKNWWYYVILLVSILMSLMLIDCWLILSTEE